MTAAHERPYCVSQAALPAPDGAFLRGVPLADLAHSDVDARPAFEGRLAGLLGVEPDRVVACAGATGALVATAARWLAGERVVVERPAHPAVLRIPAALGARVERLEREVDAGWQPDVARAHELLTATGGRAHVVVTNPHEPTGALSNAARIADLAAAAADAGGLLVCDEVWMELVPNARRVHAFALAPNALSIGSLSKGYGLGALRVGWIVLGAGLAGERDALLEDVRALAEPATPSLRAALAALESLPALVAHQRRWEAECRPVLDDWLARTPGLEVRVPADGLGAFVRFFGVSDTRALADWLGDEHGVGVEPGETFGCAGWLRLGAAVPAATLRAGLGRLAQGVDAWRAAHAGRQ